MKKYNKIFNSFSTPLYFTNFKEAELIKYLSNSLLATLISYSNEMSMLANKIKNIDKKLVKEFSRHEYFKLMIISDFITAGYLSDLKHKLTQEEINVFQDMQSYYLMTVRAGHYDSDIIELFSSRIFEEIIREIKGYVKIFNENKNKNTDEDNKKILEKINKKLLLVSSHDTYISYHIYFLGINGNNFNYDYNDELSLILHYDEKRKELFLEIKYNDKRIVAEYCQKDPNRENICEFESYLHFIEKRIHYPKTAFRMALR